MPAFEITPESSLGKTARIESFSYANPEALSFMNAIWDDDNKIYLASTYKISLLSSEDFKEVVSSQISSVPKQLILTQKHLIICYKNNLLEWVFKYDPALNDEDCKPLDVDKYYTIQEGNISEIMYDHYLEEIIVGTVDGYILLLPVQGESNNDESIDDQAGDKTPSDDENKKQEKLLEIDVQKIGPFHTSEIIYIKELRDYDILITVSRNGAIFIWNLAESNFN